MSRARYILVRTVNTIFLLWFVLTVLFLLFRLLPGDFADVLAAQGVDQESIAIYREEWGLDEPLHLQYLTYMANFLQFDFGMSLQYQIPVWDLVNNRILNTFLLVAPGITFGYIIGTVVGTILGNKRDSRFENVTVFSLVMIGSLPQFFLAIIAILIFSLTLGIFPTSGMISPTLSAAMADEAWWRVYLTTDFLSHWILPVSVVTLIAIYPSAMVMRTSVVEVTGQDFIYYHQVSGVPYRQRLKRLANHAILPVLTLFPISMGQAISGLVLIELVFNWPGIGYTLIDAVFARDYAVIQFVFFIVAAFVIIANFVVDIVYGIVDPRISVEN